MNASFPGVVVERYTPTQIFKKDLKGRNKELELIKKTGNPETSMIERFFED